MIPNTPQHDLEVNGAYLLGIADTSAYPHLNPLRQRYGLDHVQVDQWYSVTHMAAFYAEIADGDDGGFDLVDIGRTLARLIEYPPQVQTIADALAIAEDMHRASWRNGDPGDLQVDMLSDRHVRMTFQNLPLPVDLVYGMCEGMIRRFCPDAYHVVVERIEYGPLYIFEMRW